MPISDLLMRFLPAIALSAASASASGRASASGMAAGRRIAAGTVCAISSSRLDAPMAASMMAMSSAEGPIWREMNLVALLEYGQGQGQWHGVVRGRGWSGISWGRRNFLFARSRLLCTDAGIGGCVKQGIQVGTVARLHLEQPGVVSVLIDPFGCIGQRFVDLGDPCRQPAHRHRRRP